MISYKFPDDAGSIALATMGRVCADAADFGIAVQPQALAAHGDAEMTVLGVQSMPRRIGKQALWQAGHGSKHIVAL